METLFRVQWFCPTLIIHHLTNSKQNFLLINAYGSAEKFASKRANILATTLAFPIRRTI